MVKFVFALLGIALLIISVSAEVDGQVNEFKEAKALIETLSGKKAKLLTRSLMPLKGKIVRSDVDKFDLKVARGVMTLAYADVLEIEGGGRSLSFIPERSKRGHGTWRDIGRIFAGTRILVVYADSTSIKAFANSVSETHLIGIDKTGRQRIEIERENVVAVYGLLGGYGGVKAGASKGAEGMNSRRDKVLDGVFAGIGALAGLAKSDGTPVLVYSK